MIRFLSTLVHRKERKAGLFRSYVDFWKLGSICLWFASARTCVRACVRVCVRVCVCACACSCVCVCLVISNSLGSHGLQPTRLLCALNFPGKHTGVGCHFLLQGIFLTQGLNPGLPHCRLILYHLSHQGSSLLMELPKFVKSSLPKGLPRAKFSSVIQPGPTLCSPMDYSTPDFPVHCQLLELAHTHVHRVGDATQSSKVIASN